MKMKSSIYFPLLLVLALAFASVVFTKADLEFLDVKNHNSRDPEHKYKECLERCERRHEGQSFQEHCQDDCKERRRQAEERRAHEQGGSQGHEEEQRQEEERKREQQQREEERRKEERGGGKGRQEEQRQEEERKREQQREEERRKEERGGGKGRQEEQQRQEEEQQRQEEERKRAGGSSSSRYSRKQYKECLSECGRQSQGRSSQDDCKKQCKEKWQREGRQDINKNSQEEEGEGAEQVEPEQEGETSPYVFEDQHFSTIFQSEQGRIRSLPRFTERSKLLKGIDNYRVLILEAEPQTFILPIHNDADSVVFVAQGEGTVSLVRPNKRESFNIRRGDVTVIPAGTTAYVINRSVNEKLIIAKLVRPVNTPGRFEPFSGAGGEEPESFYRTFSQEILEAAFNTKRENIERIFGQQRQGAMIKASKGQIRELSRHEEGGIWPFGGGESKGKVNIFQQRSSKSNGYGQFYEVDGSNLHQLQDLNVAVSVTNISEGSMSTLLYNSRATKIAIVVNGEGYLEMACPHLSQSQEGQQESQQQEQTEERKSSPSYQKVTAQLRSGVVVVIPAGHPHVAVASENQNLEIVSFLVNANNDERLPLAGRSNVMNQLERTAKELAFGVPAKEVDEVFRNQEEEEFFKGPTQWQRPGQRERRADA